MTFTFDFDKWVWANLRSSIRRTGTNLWWYKLLSALLKGRYETRAEQLDYIAAQRFPETCPDERLYLWGQRLRERQQPGESFDDYRLRLINKKYRQEGITLAQKLRIISNMSGIDVSEMKWYKIQPYAFRVGDPVGFRVSSRDYTLNAYRIYVADNGTTNWLQVIAEIAKIEKGGQSLELWVQKTGGVQRGILPDDPVTTPEYEYDIY
jgi:hypothetical protein